MRGGGHPKHSPGLYGCPITHLISDRIQCIERSPDMVRFSTQQSLGAVLARAVDGVDTDVIVAVVLGFVDCPFRDGGW